MAGFVQKIGDLIHHDKPAEAHKDGEKSSEAHHSSHPEAAHKGLVEKIKDKIHGEGETKPHGNLADAHHSGEAGHKDEKGNVDKIKDKIHGEGGEKQGKDKKDKKKEKKSGHGHGHGHGHEHCRYSSCSSDSN
ncbi:unnamed protein product [Cuscuta epithymum]|uniref:Uncharacterized protein n=1 Tax=Cuscuta epithymum TaxID=186058 RepID=A0AAV0G958_9ASTE|nr:unnamed protein product [Cuscuta epithymum]